MPNIIKVWNTMKLRDLLGKLKNKKGDWVEVLSTLYRSKKASKKP